MSTPYFELEKRAEPYNLFILAINAEQTREKYITRLKKSFEIIGIDQEKKLSMQERCKIFVSKASPEMDASEGHY